MMLTVNYSFLRISLRYVHCADIFAPTYDSLVVSLKEHRTAVEELLQMLPSYFDKTTDQHSALGAALQVHYLCSSTASHFVPVLQVAHEIIADNGGRITVMQTVMPDRGPGALKNREDPNERSGVSVISLFPSPGHKFTAAGRTATDACDRFLSEVGARLQWSSGGD